MPGVDTISLSIKCPETAGPLTKTTPLNEPPVFVLTIRQERIVIADIEGAVIAWLRVFWITTFSTVSVPSQTGFGRSRTVRPGGLPLRP